MLVDVALLVSADDGPLLGQPDIPVSRSLYFCVQHTRGMGDFSPCLPVLPQNLSNAGLKPCTKHSFLQKIIECMI